MSEATIHAGRVPPRSHRSWRLRPWPNAPGVAHLLFLDHLALPTADGLGEAIETARAHGSRAVRTSALFPRAADVAFAHGFTPIDTLALLRVVLDDELDQRIESRFGIPDPHTRPLRPWHHRRAALVDQEAFGLDWGNDAASLAEIRAATPAHRARLVRRGRALGGFAISGASADAGYIQRVAVGTAHRRQGIARDLVLDALGWMRRRGSATAFVNTGVTNDAALALYEGFGFERLADHLTIAELRLEP